MHVMGVGVEFGVNIRAHEVMGGDPKPVHPGFSSHHPPGHGQGAVRREAAQPASGRAGYLPEEKAGLPGDHAGQSGQGYSRAVGAKRGAGKILKDRLEDLAVRG